MLSVVFCIAEVEEEETAEAIARAVLNQLVASVAGLNSRIFTHFKPLFVGLCSIEFPFISDFFKR